MIRFWSRATAINISRMFPVWRHSFLIWRWTLSYLDVCDHEQANELARSGWKKKTSYLAMTLLTAALETAQFLKACDKKVIFFAHRISHKRRRNHFSFIASDIAEGFLDRPSILKIQSLFILKCAGMHCFLTEHSQLRHHATWTKIWGRCGEVTASTCSTVFHL